MVLIIIQATLTNLTWTVLKCLLNLIFCKEFEEITKVSLYDTLASECDSKL